MIQLSLFALFAVNLFLTYVVVHMTLAFAMIVLLVVCVMNFAADARSCRSPAQPRMITSCPNGSAPAEAVPSMLQV